MDKHVFPEIFNNISIYMGFWGRICRSIFCWVSYKIPAKIHILKCIPKCAQLENLWRIIFRASKFYARFYDSLNYKNDQSSVDADYYCYCIRVSLL